MSDLQILILNIRTAYKYGGRSWDGIANVVQCDTGQDTLCHRVV